MSTLAENQEVSVRGSSGTHTLKNAGGVMSCSCLAWRNQNRHPNYRTCKHLIGYLGARQEAARIVSGGREGMPSTVDRLLADYWPTEEASRLAGIVSDSVVGPTRKKAAAPAAATKTAAAAARAAARETGDRFGLLEIDPEPKPAAAPAAATEGAYFGSDASTDAQGGVLLAHSWDGVQDVTGWLMSEKLDGVRAYWDGENFRSRLGNVFATPEWFRAGMPKTHLDGELWMGRGRFQETSGHVRRMDRGPQWSGITYQVFDAPIIPGGFEKRFASIPRLPGHCKKLMHVPCPGLAGLKELLAEVEAQGGEGLMLRQPGSEYVRGRSASLLKVKQFYDTEAVVTDTQPGKGRHKGAVGALVVRVPQDITLRVGKKTCTLRRSTQFEVGTGLSDAQRRPGVIRAGAIITVRFQELSNEGVPRFPSLVGVRDYE